MTKLAKYLKPYLPLLLVAIVLLFVQANADLNLPNYMSDIVNVGIQQGGVEYSYPAVISDNGLTLMKTFMTDEERTLADASYHKVTSGSEEYTTLAKTYTSLGDTVWAINDLSKEDSTALNTAFSQSGYAMVELMKQVSGGSNTAADMTGTSDVQFDFTQIYAMMPMLAQQQPAIDAAIETASQAPEQLTSGTGAVFAKSFLAELGADTGAIQSAYIRKTGGKMLAISLVSAAASILVGLFASRIGAGASRTLRGDVFQKVSHFTNAEFDKFSTASLITRTTNDITQMQQIITMGLRMICYAPILGIGGIFMALSKSPNMSWVLAVGVGFILILILVIYRIGMPKFKIMQKLVDKLNLVTRESLSGMMVIRAFGTQSFEEKRFDDANGDLKRTNLFVNRLVSLMFPAMMFVMNLMTVLIIWVGAHQIADSQMQIGDMLAFMQYAMQIMFSFLMLSMMFIMIPRAAVSADRINEVLSTETSIHDPESPAELGSRAKGEVEFHDVSFRYGGADADVLQHISFVAKPGETTAFIGSTGSGKSTLVNLVPRFYDVTEGSITLDGVDLRDMTQSHLRDQIGYVPQKGLLFSGTIASNLRYGDENADDALLQQAADIAQATEFISTKPEGFETLISQGGANVSGGQKQRLSIARALVKQAAVYIFDDSFSALDFKTDAALRHALHDVTRQSTVFLVAQRISTIMNAEQIIVLDDGKMVGRGTHRELMENCAAYREIALSQLSKEELA